MFSRLKKHLLEIEENNTLAQFEQEERIQQLSSRIKTLEPFQTQCESLHNKLKEQTLISERAQDALSKLQNMLDVLHSEQETEVNSEILFLRKKIDKREKEFEGLQNSLKRLQEENSKANLEIEQLKAERNNDFKTIEILKKQSIFFAIASSFLKLIIHVIVFIWFF